MHRRPHLLSHYSLRRATIRIALTCAVTIGATWIGIASYLSEKYVAAVDGTARDARNLSHAFDENIRRTLDAIDATIRAVRVARSADPAGFDLVAWDRASGLTRELTLQLAFADRDGVVTASNLGKPSTAISLSDRPHFQMARDAPDDRLLVSRPVLGRVSKRWSVQFVRKLLDDMGRFDGVVVASLDPEFLSRFSKSLDIGNSVLVLLGTDGIVRAAAPEPFVPLNANLSPSALMQAIAASPHGTLPAIQMQDRIDRIYSWRRIDPYGLVVVVGMATGDALGVFRRDAILGALLGAVLSVGVSTAGLLLARRQGQLLGSWEILRAAVENISQGLIVVDKNRRVPILNRRAAELLELPSHLTKLNVRFDDILSWQLDAGEFDGPEKTEVLELVRSGGIAPGGNTYLRKRANGTVLEIRTEALDTGLAVRTLTDITEQQRNAAAMAEARDNAEAAVLAKSEFVATMSHEIRTPLNGVIGLAELLQEMELGPTQRHYVRTIRESGDHLLQLINDILDFSRLEASRVELEQVSFDPASLVNGIADVFRTQATRKGLDLSVTLTGLPPSVIGDPGRLRQVLFNLVSNAIKFTDRGWVDIAVAGEPDSGEHVRLLVRVTDTGIGIEPAAIERMFTAFTQADGSISRRFGGSGLGLSICQHLIGLMGGVIRVDSEPGRGSVFLFDVVLRAAPAIAEAAVTPLPEQTPSHPHLNILVAEDNATNQLVVLRLLERLGHSARAVNDGAQAVAAFAEGRYDLVLMDVMMPVMDGLTATGLIRAAQPPGSHAVIIGLTAGTQPEHLRKCIAAGMDAVTTKPITLASLHDVIGEVLMRAADSPAPVLADRMAALKDELGEEVAAEIFAAFAEDTSANLLALWEAASQGDMQTCHRLAHSISGAAHNVGLGALAKRARSLEESYSRMGVPQLMAVVASLQRDFDEGLPKLSVNAPLAA